MGGNAGREVRIMSSVPCVTKWCPHCNVWFPLIQVDETECPRCDGPLQTKSRKDYNAATGRTLKARVIGSDGASLNDDQRYRLALSGGKGTSRRIGAAPRLTTDFPF